MSQRYRSGGSGRFTFSELNALQDKVDRVEGRQPLDRRFLGPKLDPFVAKLGAPLEGEFFEDGPDGQKRPVFDWSMVMIEAAPTKRKIKDKPRAPKSQRFGPAPKGRAVCLAGDPQPGDIVLMFPLIATRSERWFAFTAKLAALGSVTLLRIDGSEEIEEDTRYKYDVTPVAFTLNGGLGPSVGHVPGKAFNTYELEGDTFEWGHGQSLYFPGSPPKELEPDGPVEGVVLGVLCKAPEIVGSIVYPAIYGFEASVPLIPRCNAAAAAISGSPDKAIEILLNRGIA